MSPAALESDYTQANLECNVSKNRYLSALPSEWLEVMFSAQWSVDGMLAY